LIVIFHPKYTGKTILLLPLGMLSGIIMAKSHDKNSMDLLPYLVEVHLVPMTLKVMQGC
jgi:hypothetical protein